MVVLRMVDVANVLVLNSFMDGTVRSCAKETLFEVFGGWGEVTWVLLITQIARLLGRVFGRERSGIDLGSEWSVGVAVDDCGDGSTGCAGLFDND